MFTQRFQVNDKTTVAIELSQEELLEMIARLSTIAATHERNNNNRQKENVQQCSFPAIEFSQLSGIKVKDDVSLVFTINDAYVQSAPTEHQDHGHNRHLKKHKKHFDQLEAETEEG